MISIQGVYKNFGQTEVLKNINLEISTGEKVLIIGPSGSGKSTLIRCINGLEKVTSGKIVVNGKDVTDKKNKQHEISKEVAMVFQSFNLYPHKTVLQNLTLAPIKVLGVKKEEAERTAYEYLDRVGMREKADAYPAQLSGGQQQRVAIARALNMHPEILLFDEPTSALDPEMIREVLEVIIDLAKSNKTLVVVSHEMGFARQAADRVIFMDEGEIVAVGTPTEVFDNSTNERVLEFLSKIL